MRLLRLLLLADSLHDDPVLAPVFVQIRSMAPLSSLAPCPLQELYLASNKIGAICSISEFTDLRVLELGSNRIKVVPFLEDNNLMHHLS